MVESQTVLDYDKHLILKPRLLVSRLLPKHNLVIKLYLIPTTKDVEIEELGKFCVKLKNIRLDQTPKTMLTKKNIRD